MLKIDAARVRRWSRRLCEHFATKERRARSERGNTCQEFPAIRHYLGIVSPLISGRITCVNLLSRLHCIPPQNSQCNLHGAKSLAKRYTKPADGRWKYTPLREFETKK